MTLRNALLSLLVIICLTAWWQVEGRLTAAQSLNQKLSMEAAHLMKTPASKRQQPEVMATPPAWAPASTALDPMPDAPKQESEVSH